MNAPKPIPELGAKDLKSQGEVGVPSTNALTASKTAQVEMKLKQSPTGQYGTWGRIEMIDGKKYLIRPSVRLGKDGNIEEFAQKVPILSLEVNGEKIELLGLPLEAMGMTSTQQEEFKKSRGLINPSIGESISMYNEGKMMYWAESFETQESEIDGILYKGFTLFRKVYEGFPHIARMTQEEAMAQGLYPTIHYRNFVARKGIADMIQGHLATLDKNHNGQLFDIYKAAEGKTNLQKLAAMGQAPLGCRDADGAWVCNLGNWARLGSGSLNGDSDVRTLGAHRDKADADNLGFWQRRALSSVVVLDK